MSSHVSLSIVLFFLGTCSGLVIDLKTADDGRSVFHINSFGYEEDGVFDLQLKDFVLLVPSAHKAEYGKKETEGKLVFVLQHTRSGGIRVEESSSSSCFHTTDKNISEKDKIILIPFEVIAEKQTLKEIIKIKEPGSYHLYFSNCLPGTKIGFDLELKEYDSEYTISCSNVCPFRYNVVMGEKVFLPAGKAILPMVYGLLFVAFLGSFFAWIFYLCAHHQHVVSIHLLMMIVVAFKACTLFSEAFESHWLKTTGKPHGWNVAFYVFSFLKGMLLFAVIVLIGTGWSYLKPYLTERDKQVMLVVIVVQAMVNVAMVMLDETAPGAIGWLTWRDLLHLLDMLCCCAILLPIVWSIRHLSASSERGATRDADRLKQFRLPLE